MEIKPFSQVMDEVVKSCEEQEKASMEITIQDGYIVMNCDGIEYEIPLDECRTVYGALKWLLHMEEKTWVTYARLRRIAECMVEYDSVHKENPFEL